METLNQPSFLRAWTLVHLSAYIIIFLMAILFRCSIDTFFDETQGKINLYNSIYEFKNEIFNLHKWLPLEVSYENSGSKYFCFFIGEVFVSYITINLYFGPQFAQANAGVKFNKPYQPEPSEKLFYLQIIFCLYRLVQSMLFATLVSLWAFYTSYLIYKDFCRSRWKARGSKEERPGRNLIIGDTFPEEAESMAFLIFIILCFVRYGHVSGVFFSFFLLLGAVSFFIGGERSLMLLIGLHSVNIPLVLLAAINPRPLSNFEESGWEKNLPKLKNILFLTDIDTDIVNIYSLFFQYVLKDVVTHEMAIVHDNNVDEKACIEKRKEVENNVSFQSQTHPIVKTKRKRNNKIYWS